MTRAGLLRSHKCPHGSWCVGHGGCAKCREAIEAKPIAGVAPCAPAMRDPGRLTRGVRDGDIVLRSNACTDAEWDRATLKHATPEAPYVARSMSEYRRLTEQGAPFVVAPAPF